MIMAHSSAHGLNTRGTISSLSRHHHQHTLRYAVLGAGFAGLSVAWHLLNESSRELNIRIDIYDEVGIGGGASGISGGLLHPYSPKAKLLWRGSECWNESLKLLSIAEATAKASGDFDLDHCQIVRRRGILRPAANAKNLSLLSDNARNCLPSCKIEILDREATQNLVPNLCVPLGKVFYMPEAVNINPQLYVQALFLACENLANKLSNSGAGKKNLCLLKESVQTLRDLEGEYQAVVVCLGAKADLLPELSGKIPIRTCRGVVAHLNLPDGIGEEYPELGPSILSDAWLAIHGPRSLCVGSTWEWRSRNSSQEVSESEASRALEELLPKAHAIYPGLKNWTFSEARAGLRAMPPLSPDGSLPLMGCLDGFVGGEPNNGCKYWLFTGLGARGLLYHGWLGKLVAKAALDCNEQLIPSELTSWKNIVD